MNSILYSSAHLIHKRKISQSMNKRWFPPGQLAAGYTWQERQRMPVDDGIHNMVAILLFQTLLRHSVRTGFQRAGVHSPPVSFQNISGTREREQSVLTSIWNYFILASGDLNTRHVFPCPMAVFTMNMTSKQICSATEENNQSCIQIQERSITKSTQCKEKSGFFPYKDQINKWKQHYQR